MNGPPPAGPVSGFVGRWSPAGAQGHAWCRDVAAACWLGDASAGLAFVGELYNGDALCAQLGLDVGTALPALLRASQQRWGPACAERWDGVFTAAFWGPDGLRLHCDASGLRHLYVHAAPGTGQVSFATHLPALWALPGVERRLSRPSLHEYLRFLDIAPPNTLYEGVQSLPGGHWRVFDAHGEQPAPEAAPATATAAAAPPAFDDAVDRLDQLLGQGVQARLAGAQRPAAFLSGGIDSALLCAQAVRQGVVPAAITVGFDGERFDESPIAGRIAAHLGLPHRVLRFDRAQVLQAFDTLARQMEQPMADPATPVTVLAYAHCREHFDAVLDGVGADEAVGAMPPRHVRLAVGQASRLPAPLRRATAQGLRRVPALAGYAPIFDFEHPAETLVRWRGFTRRDIQALCGEPVSLEHTHFFRTFARFPRLAHFLRYSALLDAMPSDRSNEALGITGAPVRFPFWDRATDGFLRALPEAFRWQPQQPKRILRALLARHVPASIWDQPKHSFDFPLQAFLAGDGHALVRRHLDAARWQPRGLLDATRVASLAREFMAGDSGHVFRVWALVVLDAWLEAHAEPR